MAGAANLDLGPLSQDEIEGRLPVWAALADTFLDTEHDDSFYIHVAHKLSGCGYSWEQVEWIYRYEVAPAFCVNLISPAGEWTSWPDDFVRERVLAKRRWGASRLASRLMFSNYISMEWSKIQSHVAQKEAGK